MPEIRDVYSPIREQDVIIPAVEPGWMARRKPELKDEAAGKLVVQDAATAEQWLDAKQWAMQWREADTLYQSPRLLATWEGSGVTRANVSRFTVAKHVNALVPTMISGIFYADPPMKLRPRPGTTQLSARAWEALLSALLAAMQVQYTVEVGSECQVLNGTVIYKATWGKKIRVQKRYVRKTAPALHHLRISGSEVQVHTKESDEFEVEETEITHSDPCLEFKPLGSVLVDPKWNTPNCLYGDKTTARYIIDRHYPTFEDLDRLREQEGYAIPSTEELKEYFFPSTQASAGPPSAIERQQQANAAIHHAEGREMQTTADPLAHGMEMLERVEPAGDGRVMTVLRPQGCDKYLLIRNEPHCGTIRYFAGNWWNILNAGYGMGVGKLVGSDQRLEQGSTNAAVDILSLAVNPGVIVNEQLYKVPTQNIRQRLGGIKLVQGEPDKAMKYEDVPKVPGEIWATIQNARSSADNTSGADEAVTQGNVPGRGSSIVRTATGAGGVMAANATKIAGPVGKFVNGVFLPFLQWLDEMVRERMPMSEIRAILGEQMGEDIAVDMDNFINASLRYEVLAGAHLAAKRAMAQSLPLYISVLENPHLVQQLNATGWTVDVKELYAMFQEMSEWKNTRDLIRKMTPEEQQMFKQMNPALQRVQGDLMKGQQAHQNKSEEIDQQAEARLAHDLVLNSGERAAAVVERAAFRQDAAPFALTGAPA